MEGLWLGRLGGGEPQDGSHLLAAHFTACTGLSSPHSVSELLCTVGIIIPAFWMRKLRLRELVSDLFQVT